MIMTEFDRKVEEASVRFNRSVANIAETLEKETAELVAYLNDDVVPAVRTHSSSALLSGCGGRKHTPAEPPPPALPQEKEKPLATPPSADIGEDEKIDVPAGARPIFEETGIASWYGAPYHNRRGSNGEVYNMHAMTAAHL